MAGHAEILSTLKELKPEEMMAVSQTMLLDLIEWYRQQQQHNPHLSATSISQLAVLALTQYAATVAVDVHMPQPRFVAVSIAQYVEAYNKAPKFG